MSIKKLGLASACLLLSMLGLSAQKSVKQTWEVDPLHSQVIFRVSHMGIAEVQGLFQQYEVQFSSPKETFEDATLSMEIEVGSISTGVEMRDGHLKSPDFFDVEKYPTMVFASNSFKRKKGSDYEMKGNLTMKGVTKPVTLKVKTGKVVTDLDGNRRIGFVAKTVVNRQDFGVAFNKKMDNDEWLVDNMVEIYISMEFFQKVEQ